MSTPWVIELNAGGASGDLTQLYDPQMPVGAVVAGAGNPGDLVRKPSEGQLHSIQVQPDGSNGGTVELYDISGEDIGADVSTADAITDAQLTTLLAAGKARLMWTQTFAANAANVKAETRLNNFSKGLAARFVAAMGTVKLNIVVDGGGIRTRSGGA